MVSGCQAAGCICRTDLSRKSLKAVHFGAQVSYVPTTGLEDIARSAGIGEGVTVPCHPAFDFQAQHVAQLYLISEAATVCVYVYVGRLLGAEN